MNKNAEKHPERETLVAFGLGKLDRDQARQVENHLEHCADCCDTVADLELKDDTFVSLVRNSPATDEAQHAQADATSDVVASPSPDAATDQPIQATVDVQSGATGVATKFADLPRDLREHPRYEILELIGHGGMGDVYKAQHKVMNRLVALKVIKPELVRNEAAVSRFRREVQAAAQLHHNNIVTAHDAEQAGNLHFLVMEHVDGVDLDEVIREQGALPVEQACDYIRQVAQGLQHAYERGMVHRDIKPHNLMVTGMRNAERGMRNEEADSALPIPHSALVKILDFGLANFANEVAEDELKQADESEDSAQQSVESNVPGASILHQLTQMGTMMGTPDYIAPEQAKDAHTADIRADIYSLGCTFYTLLTGQAPFGESSVIDKINAHTQQDAPPLSEFRDDVPPEVDAVLQKMMAKDPAERFQTPAEVAEALSAVGRIGNPSYKKRRPLVLTAVATLFLALIAAAATIFYIQTDNGVVRVEVTDPSLQVTIAGRTITTDDNGKPLTIRAGEQKLIVRQNDSDFELVTDSFQLRRGERVAIKVDRLPGQVVVSKDGERFGARALPASAFANEIRLVFDHRNGYDVLEIPGVLTTKDAETMLQRIRAMVAENPDLVVVLDFGAGIEPNRPNDLDQIRRHVAATGASVKLAPRLLALAQDNVNNFRLRAERSNDLKQIGIALLSYQEAHRFFPPTKHQRESFDEDGQPHLSWRVHILPYMEQEELYKRFRFNEPWDSEHNKPLLAEMPPQFKTTEDPTQTTFLAVVGEGTAYEGKAGLTLDDINKGDGASNTAYIVDAGNLRLPTWKGC